MNRTEYPRWADDGQSQPARSSPPSQPQGWVDPDPLYVEPEPVEPRVRYQGWDPASKPVSHDFAWFGLGICVGIIVLALIFTFGRQLDAASRSGQTTDPIDVSRASSAALSRAPTPGAPSARAEAPVPSPPAAPTGEVGTALVGGWATYYATCSDCAAAGPLLQAVLGPHWKGQTITVVSDIGQVDLRLVTSCACGDRTRNGVTRPTIIDVSLEAFGELSASPAGSATDPGYVQVSIEIGGPASTLPPTDLPPHPDDERMRLEVRGDELYQ